MQYITNISIGQMDLGKKVLFTSTDNPELVLHAIKNSFSDLEKETLEYAKECLTEDTDIVVETLRTFHKKELMEFFLHSGYDLKNVLSEQEATIEDADLKELAITNMIESDVFLNLLKSMTVNAVDSVSIGFKENENTVISLIKEHIQNERQEPIKFYLNHELKMLGEDEGFAAIVEKQKVLIDFLQTFLPHRNFFKEMFKTTLFDPSFSKKAHLSVLVNNRILVVK